MIVLKTAANSSWNGKLVIDFAAANAAAFVGIMLAGPACNGINALMNPSTGFAMIAVLSLAVALVLPRMLRDAGEEEMRK